MMVGWLLILFAHGPTDAVAVTQAGPFADQAACTAAGQAAKRTPGRMSVDFVCVPNAIEPKG
jgi:hypothetical protein